MNMRQIRKDKGMTLDGLAQAVDVDISTISRIERSLQMPSLKLASDIADQLDTKIDDLFPREMFAP